MRMHQSNALHRVSRLLAIGALVNLGACKDATPPLVPTAIVVSLPSLVLDAVGASEVVTIVVNDQNGAPLANAVVTWTSSAPTVVSVTGGLTATVTALGPGIATLTVTAGTVQSTIQVTVAQVAVVPQKTAGDGQIGTVGAALSTGVQVRLLDRLGSPIAGRIVTFVPGAASGSVAPASVTSSADGTASATWTLGTTVGAQTLVASTAGAPQAATFTATARAGPPASVSVNGGNNQTAVAGTAVATAPSVRVSDAFGNAVSGVGVTFGVAAGAGSVTGVTPSTNASGVASVGSWTLGTVAGTMTMVATVQGLTPVTFTATAVAGPPADVVASAGSTQTAPAGTAVPVPPAVRVSDTYGNAVAGVPVTFAVTAGGGSVTGADAVTNAGGIATVGGWTLGPAAGANSLTATATAAGTLSGNPVSFSAMGTAPGDGSFRIEVRYLTAGTPAQTAAVTAAVARWQTIITADLPDIAVSASAALCGANSPAINETIDDLLVFVTFEPIDGVGGTLGSAGPCFVRNSNGLPVVGRMRFDVADLAIMEGNGTLNAVILHEMAHILGVGTIWDLPPFFSLLANPSLPSSPGVDTRYTGANGIAGFNLIGGATYTGGGKVPVENTQGGVGTRDAHWRESVLANELMTGFVTVGLNPLSVLTIRSLQDLGYTIDASQADTFFLILTAAAARAAPGERVFLYDDVTRDPIMVIGDRGEVVRVIRPPPR